MTDCGHVCCDERGDPYHDHFLAAADCPRCRTITGDDAEHQTLGVRRYEGAYRGDGCEDDYVLLGGDRDEYRRMVAEAREQFADPNHPINRMRRRR